MRRCLIQGCDNQTNPQYLAEWMDEFILQDLHANPKSWQCEIPKHVVLPECSNNISANITCDHWVFDKSVFTSTIVTDVMLLIIYCVFRFWFLNISN